MTKLSQEIKQLHRQILDLSEGERYRLQPRLAGLLGQMRHAGEPVPAAMQRLNETLLDEAIEAQFENMPV
ncbi:hypothetical protein FIU89_07300 [Roseovarius sp. THAF27]|uniref:hypothetical protein n=1 Tax=Roseovarius TaxID=74030 RepID=UPI001269044C|nr:MULTISPECIES: hypothetical protein [Roseovarius]MBY5988174.1 hypothetical protein [Roseovarius atlanticus]MBY6123565.1 hypothetical protein [Roseovarius atlanticus]MBY6148060.1 hypothetical protein [Roseovarius atlanticus]QFT80412.1 hypothetical protein FIU89_07300 [Roseovarius sp. THAF27]QFT96459.1 hypothetical protein FIU85_04020 [Roseovarius sp. THAF8]